MTGSPPPAHLVARWEAALRGRNTHMQELSDLLGVPMPTRTRPGADPYDDEDIAEFLDRVLAALPPHPSEGSDKR